MFGKLTLVPGASIGKHQHIGETEYYWILQGEGIVTEADGEKHVKAGDLVITGGGATHAIRNEGTQDLVFMALIILDYVTHYPRHFPTVFPLSDKHPMLLGAYIFPYSHNNFPLRSS
jgi:quercetin dioxygenase-like cupin family protein